MPTAIGKFIHDSNDMKTPSLSILLPVRIDNEERLANLKAVLNWIVALDCPVLVLEASATPQLAEWFQTHSRVEYYYVHDDSPVFHRTKYINRLLQQAVTRYVAVWDADIILPLHQVEQTLQLMERESLVMAYPYSGIFSMLSAERSERFRKHLSLSAIPSAGITSLMGRRACGGVYFVNRSAYLALGGENERYDGWGPEDAERLRRMQIMGVKVAWLSEGKLYHLYHHRNPQQEGDNCPQLIRMRQEFIHECSMDKEAMSAYIRQTLLPQFL